MATNSPYRTSDDLITKVLSKLGVLSTGQAIDPEDYSRVQDSLDSIVRKLAALEIVYVPDVENIPGAWFLDLASIVAGETCTDFGVTDSDYVKLVNSGLGGVGGTEIGAGMAALSLKAMNRGRPTYEPLRTESF